MSWLPPFPPLFPEPREYEWDTRNPGAWGQAGMAGLWHLPAAALPGALDGPRVPASVRRDPMPVAGGSHLSSRKDLAAGMFI